MSNLRIGLVKPLVSFLCLLALGGCGGGGGSSSNSAGGSAARATVTGISQDYYPVLTGSNWSYDSTSSVAPASFITDIQVTGTQQVAGQNAYVFHESDPSGSGDSYYIKDAGAFTFVGDSAPANFIKTIIGNFDEMRFDGTFSATPLVNKIDVDIGEDLDGDHINERMDLVITGVVEGSETLVTSAGSFANTMRLRFDLTNTVRLSTGRSVTVSQTVREWRAPGVGMVQQFVTKTQAGTTTSVSMALRGFSVNGAVGGVLPMKQLMSGLAAANSDTSQPGRPAMASDGTNFLVVSKRVATSSFEWVAQLVGPDGTALTGINLTSALSSPQNSYMPAVSWDGTNYLVLTSDYNGLRGQRVSASGAVIDLYPGMIISADGGRPSVAYGGGVYFIVYLKYQYPGPHELYGRLVTPSGGLGAEMLLATNAIDITNPAVAFDGSNFLVAWEVGIGSISPQNTDLVATRVSSSGVLLDAVPFAISTASEAQTSPQIACDGTNCLISWVDRRNYPGSTYSLVPGPGDMYGAFVSKAGLLLSGPVATGGVALATGITANQGYPALVFTGTEYLLAWSRGAFANNPSGSTGIFVARVSTNGTIVPAVNVSGPPATSSTLPYMALATSSKGTLAVWLNNTQQSGTTKTINGAMIFPLAVR